MAGQYFNSTEAELNALPERKKTQITEAFDNTRFKKFVGAIEAIGVSNFLELPELIVNEESRFDILYNRINASDMTDTHRNAILELLRASYSSTTYARNAIPDDLLTNKEKLSHYLTRNLRGDRGDTVPNGMTSNFLNSIQNALPDNHPLKHYWLPENGDKSQEDIFAKTSNEIQPFTSKNRLFKDDESSYCYGDSDSNSNIIYANTHPIRNETVDRLINNGFERW